MTANSRHPGAGRDLLERYARRIGYTGSLQPTLSNLQQITWLHQLSIPFENLDIALFRRPISLTPAALVAKLVDAKRGGFCYEQNGLMALVLQQMGCDVSMGYGTWLTGEGPKTAPFDHLLLEVTIPGEPGTWLVDVGFGRDSPARPVPISADIQASHPETGITYRPSRSALPDRQWTVEQRKDDEPWRPLYDLDLRPRAIIDYVDRSQYHQTSPESSFTRGSFCSKPIAGGRVTIASGTLIITRHGVREERPLINRQEEAAALREWFGIDISDEEGSA